MKDTSTGDEIEETGKIVKVTIEFEHVLFIAEGRDAEKWSHEVSCITNLAFIHGHRPGVNWTEIKKVHRE